MKVLLIGLTPPEEGGSQRHIFEIAERINEVTVLTQQGSRCRKKIELPIINSSILLRNLTFFFMCCIYSIKLLLLEKKYDLIHIHENLLYLLAPFLSLKYKIVVTVHGINGFKFHDSKYLWSIFRAGLSAADCLIAVSKEDEKALKPEFRRVVYIPNGVDLSAYASASFKIENKISFIGRVHEQKGLIYLLTAFDKIKAKIPGYKLEIIGKLNDYSSQLMQQFPDRRIIWRGFISDRKEIASSLKSAYCIALPSLWEGLPLTLFEALASSRPVILSNIQVFRSIAKNHALFCKVKDSEDLANKLLSLINSRQQAESYGKKGYALSKNYDWKEITRTTFKTYDKTLNHE